MINDNGRVLTMFMLPQVGGAVRAHSRQCQSTRGLPAVVGRSQTKGLDLGCTNLPQATIIDSLCYFFDVRIPVIIAYVVVHIMYDMKIFLIKML